MTAGAEVRCAQGRRMVIRGRRRMKIQVLYRAVQMTAGAEVRCAQGQRMMIRGRRMMIQ
ncbi:hypothetical protein KFL_017420010, partial [Klebsormidium nitens]